MLSSFIFKKEMNVTRIYQKKEKKRKEMNATRSGEDIVINPNFKSLIEINPKTNNSVGKRVLVSWSNVERYGPRNWMCGDEKLNLN